MTPHYFLGQLAHYLRAAFVTLMLAVGVLSSHVSAEPFTVGVALPLTGDIAAYGHAVRNGFAMSTAESPSSKAQMRFEDNRYDARESLSAFRKLVDQQKVDLLFSWGETPLQSIATLIERAGVPTLAMSLDPSPAYGKKWIVVTVNHPRDFIKTLRERLRKQGVRSVGFLLAEDPFSQALYQEFATSALPGETVELIGSVTPRETDLRSLTLKASKGKYDALGIYLLSGQIQRFYREAARIGFTPVTFGTDGFESREEVDASGKAIHGAIYPNLAVPADFQRRYAYIVGLWIHSTFGSPVGSSDTKPDRESVRKALMAASFQGGATLAVSPQNSTHIVFPLVVRQITQDGFRDVGLD
jgi:branched-chain amino acid transport system substrate-binding protein